jgi:hypothetical protein
MSDQEPTTDELRMPPRPVSLDLSKLSERAQRMQELAVDLPAQQAFLDRLARTGLFSHSAEAAGYCAQSFRNVMKRSEEFAALVQEARDAYVERLERIADVRGFEGYEERTEVTESGTTAEGSYEKTKTTTRNIVSDTLAVTRLKALAPDKYRDNVKVDQTVRGGVLVVQAPFASDEEMEAEMRRVAERQAALKAQREASGS